MASESSNSASGTAFRYTCRVYAELSGALKTALESVFGPLNACDITAETGGGSAVGPTCFDMWFDSHILPAEKAQSILQMVTQSGVPLSGTPLHSTQLLAAIAAQRTGFRGPALITGTKLSVVRGYEWVSRERMSAILDENRTLKERNETLMKQMQSQTDEYTRALNHLGQQHER